MVSTAVWITSDEARIFKFAPEGIIPQHLRKHGPKHSAEVHGRNHTKQEDDSERFFHEVAQQLIKDKADRWLILGPGLAKSHFKSHVERHHANYTRNIVGVEAMDKATDGEITHFAHDYFKKLGVFDSL